MKYEETRFLCQKGVMRKREDKRISLQGLNGFAGESGHPGAPGPDGLEGPVGPAGMKHYNVVS